MPVGSMPRTSLQIRAIAASSAVSAGAHADDRTGRSREGSGNKARSTLLDSVIGSFSSSTNADGIMWSARTEPDQNPDRAPFERVRAISDGGTGARGECTRGDYRAAGWQNRHRQAAQQFPPRGEQTSCDHENCISVWTRSDNNAALSSLAFNSWAIRVAADTDGLTGTSVALASMISRMDYGQN
jgi:hypothetical protein